MGDEPVLGEGRIAGFWIRLFADILDAVVLGAIGFLITTVFRDGLLRLGERAALLGIPFTLLYTGVLQSHIGGGQTLAKRLLGLRVLRLDGQFLSLDRSLVRWSIMGILCYGTAVAYAFSSVAPGFLAWGFASAIGGAQLALSLGCIFLVPFHPLKRGFHDLLTGSIVIRNGKLPVELIQRVHNPRRDRRLVIAGVVVAALGTVVGLAVASRLIPSGQSGARVLKEISAMGIQNAAVTDVRFGGAGQAMRTIAVTGYLPTTADGSARVPDAEDKILALVRREFPLDASDKIAVSLRKGITVGIYSSYESSGRLEPAIAPPPTPDPPSN
jgi:uncharacterized RDD family membrane protein YckC